MVSVVAFAPGRVNLIGDHTDYTGGFALPMAIQLGTTVHLEAGGGRIHLVSSDEPQPADLPMIVTDPSGVDPAWARYVAGVVNEIRPPHGGRGYVSTTLPIGAGLSSSASLEVALALALGFTGSPIDLARACQRAEQRASGVPCGIMDQLASAGGVAGCALLLDCRSEQLDPVPLPDGCEVVAVHCGQPRRLAGSAYAERREACERAEAVIGPLRDAGPDDLRRLEDPVTRRRARHVLSENARVIEFVTALRAGNLPGAGTLMAASHASLRDDFEVSTPALDELVSNLSAQPGVYGARLTGAGFGGCAVALTEPGALDVGWRLEASGGARRLPPS
jgi:galactokinase